MIKIFINKEVALVSLNSTILEASAALGFEIPRFCFHEHLFIAGNCRMCLVELAKVPKLIVSCATPVIKNMEVFTDTPLVKKAREGILEFLLINHPLDCPVCDQGGECDLQDQIMFFGTEKSRFFDKKRILENKTCGPLIKTIMSRCIHCTRCVRFALNIAGVEDFGTTGRGMFTEIGTYITQIFQTELSGNVIDLCPVGALTSKPYAFLARPWDLKSTETIDFTDAVGSKITIDYKGTEAVRFYSSLNSSISEGWISDRSRFYFDSLKKQRLNTPYIKKSSFLISCLWEEIILNIEFLFRKTKSFEISILCSIFSDLKTMELIKTLAGILGIRKIGYPRDFKLNVDFSENFLCNTSLDHIDFSDFCILIGINPRYEASALNLKLRKQFRKGLFKFLLIGLPHDLTYKSTILGVAPKTIIKITQGKHFLCKDLRTAKKPLIFFGASLVERKDFQGLQQSLFFIADNTKIIALEWFGLCFLNQESNQAGAFDTGLKAFHYLDFFENQKICILLGLFRTEELSYLERKIPASVKLIFIGTKGCEYMTKASLVLPTTNFLEKKGLYINLEGKIQKAAQVASKNVLAKQEQILLLLIIQKFCSKKWINNKNSIYIIASVGFIKKIFFFQAPPRTQAHLSYVLLKPFLTDFYTSDSLTVLSITMAKCSHFYRASFKNFL